MPFTLLSASSISGGVGDSLRPNAKPLIINGDMAVSQRGTSNTSITSSGYYTCDRFKFNRDGIGTWTVTQESLSSGNAYNNGFRKAIRLDCTSATASPSAADNLSLITRLEGQDLQLFKKGTSNAEKFTLAFWVKSNKTGTSQVNLRDTDNTRLISATYTISSANTWEHKVLNYAADTTGPFNNDNANSLQIEWFLDSGTNFSSGTAPTSWEASDNTDRNANNLALGNSTDNDFAITGIQLEVGEYTSSTLPPFQHESYGDNLARCHRYFLYTGGGSSYQHHGSGVEVSSTAAYMTTPLTVPMRASPSITANNTSGGLVIYDGNSEGVVTSVGTTNYSPNTSLVNVAVYASGGGIDDGNGITVYSSANSNAGFLFNAEL
jgi:hypothetical protein